MAGPKTYGRKFYENQAAGSAASARVVLETLAPLLPPVRSVVDFGCGSGAWLAVAADLFDTDDYLGLEGALADGFDYAVPRERIRAQTLAEPVALDRRFDLAMSLEVAEHLPARAADGFVDSLCQAADTVLFSAAIPHQGGVGHVNEQWPDYWTARFERRGLRLVDTLRPRLWRDERVAYWYRQNCLLFTRDDRVSVAPGDAWHGEAMVHPAHIERKTRSLVDRFKFAFNL